jgi:hypothetical protein
MKASDMDLFDVKVPNYGNHNCRKINSKLLQAEKWQGLKRFNQHCIRESFFGSGSWNESFMDQCASFPNDTHDDMVDVLAYAIHEYFMTRTLMFLIVKNHIWCSNFSLFYYLVLALDTSFGCVFFCFYISKFLHKFVKTSKESGRIF